MKKRLDVLSWSAVSRRPATRRRRHDRRARAGDRQARPQLDERSPQGRAPAALRLARRREARHALERCSRLRERTASTSARRPEGSPTASSRAAQPACTPSTSATDSCTRSSAGRPSQRPRARQRAQPTSLPSRPRSSSSTSRSSRSSRRCRRCAALRPGRQALVLVKPQFEAGRADTPKGVVRDLERVLTGVARRLLVQRLAGAPVCSAS